MAIIFKLLSKAVIPSWNFFDDFSAVIELFYRESADLKNFSDWQTFNHSQSRSFAEIFFNPYGNLDLALSALSEKLVDEINDLNPSDVAANGIENHVTYLLLRKMIEARLPTSKYYQFKICLVDAGNSNAILDQALLSGICEAGDRSE